MSRKLTQEELAEPDVEIIVDPAKYNRLPQDLRRDLAAYRTSLRYNETTIVITLPAYRLRDLEAEIQRRGLTF